MSDTRTAIGQPGSAGVATTGEPSFANELPPAVREQVSAICGLLDDLGCDDDTRAAAWCYALALAQPQEWTRQAGALSEDVRRLVDGQQQAETVWRLYRDHGGRGGAEGLRRLLLAIIRDLRVVYLLLSRQLATMRAASRWPEAERRELAALTADIHAPLANRLGIWQWKWELEDLAFRYLQPDTYQRIARLLDERRGDRETYIRRCVRELEAALRKEAIVAEVAGRPKHIHSIWKKMQRKGIGFGELYDIRALRVLVDGVGHCYAALGVTHALWPNLPGEFDDYIARPKGNDYRSLHTAVLGPEGRTLEVQIRTREMHRAAELGVAAHWRYKEGGSDAAYQMRVAWMRRLLEAREEDGGDGALLAGLQGELVEDRVYLLTPKGEVFDLAAGATVLDFAYHVHTQVGHRCRGAKVNGRIVPLTHQPVSGDRVEILTGREPAPRRDWLIQQQGFLHTAGARGKVRAWFRRSDHAANLAAGRQVLERELKRLALGERTGERVYAKLGLKSHDDLLIALALGEIGSGQFARALGEAEAPAQPVGPVRAQERRSAEKPGALVIEGVGNLLTALACCCQPLPGDAVSGFITRGRGVTVHRADCASLARLRARAPERVIEVHWGETGARAYEVQIAVTGYDRKNLHKDITTVIANAGAQIAYSESRADAARGEVRMHFGLRLHDFAELSALLARLSALPNVIDAHRLAAR